MFRAGRKRLTLRKLGVLVDHLPPEAAVITAVRNALPEDSEPAGGEAPDPAAGRWSTTEMLLAAVVDEIRVLTWLYVSAHTGKGTTPPRPAPLPRPGVDRRPAARRLTEEQRRALDPRLRLIHGEGGG